MKRQNISSGAVWESTIGYSRAVRVGNVVEVAGTTAMDGDQVIGIGNAYEQTRFILHKIEKALQEAGATLQQVVRTRIFVTDISQWEAVGRAHGESFSEIKPAATMVQVSALIRPEQLVEIEATAIIEADDSLINSEAIPDVEV
ncbi:RidA family protein [Pontibacter sp. BT731]|uniref:RidA family protein n=1 Tax=Pontibacter coccineus TaxID=3063328 RepID=UPI0026E2AA2D|nr:RidA family protein [Pontibacter sp. BT731]MDO6392009.1 RidA family protein [Pontibacter sp. BT731]